MQMVYLIIITLAAPSLALLLWGILKMRTEAQHRYDAARKLYSVIYPRTTTEQSVKDWIAAIGSDLIPNSGDNGSIPTLGSAARSGDSFGHAA